MREFRQNSNETRMIVAGPEFSIVYLRIVISFRGEISFARIPIRDPYFPTLRDT